MAKKKAAPPPPPEIQEKTQTIFEVNGETYTTREEAERAVLVAKIAAIMDQGDDSLLEVDLYRDDVIEWIINHLEELVALRGNT